MTHHLCGRRRKSSASHDCSHIVCGHTVCSVSLNLPSTLKSFKWQRELMFQSYIHQRNTLGRQCAIISDFKKMTRVLWSVIGILSAEPAARKLLLKPPTSLICANIVGIIIHPCLPKSRSKTTSVLRWL